MPAYPPADDRLRHLIAQEINLSVDTWKLALWIADGIVKSPEIRAELERIAAAHHKGQHCGDRHCQRCFEVTLAKDEARALAANCTEHVGEHVLCDRCGTSDHFSAEAPAP